MDEPESGPFKLPADWKLPKAWGEWALEERDGWKAKDVRKASTSFHEHHSLKGNTRASWGEWELAWRFWIRNEKRIGAPEEKSERRNWGRICATQGCDKLGTVSHQGGGPWHCWEHYYNHFQRIQNVLSFSPEQQAHQSEHS